MKREQNSESAQDARRSALERRTLGWVLLVNFAQAVIVGVAGVFAEALSRRPKQAARLPRRVDAHAGAPLRRQTLRFRNLSRL